MPLMDDFVLDGEAIVDVLPLVERNLGSKVASGESCQFAHDKEAGPEVEVLPRVDLQHK